MILKQSVFTAMRVARHLSELKDFSTKNEALLFSLQFSFTANYRSSCNMSSELLISNNMTHKSSDQVLRQFQGFLLVKLQEDKNISESSTTAPTVDAGLLLTMALHRTL
jgi:hypothetical protein